MEVQNRDLQLGNILIDLLIPAFGCMLCLVLAITTYSYSPKRTKHKVIEKIHTCRKDMYKRGKKSIGIGKWFMAGFAALLIPLIIPPVAEAFPDTKFFPEHIGVVNDSHLQVGRPLTGAMLTEIQANFNIKTANAIESWRRIAPTFAGTWESVGPYRSFIKHFPTQNTVMDIWFAICDYFSNLNLFGGWEHNVRVYGYQKDADGNIWDLPTARSVQQGENAGFSIVQLISCRKLLKSSGSELTACLFYTELAVSNARIMSVLQREVLEHYVNEGDGLTKCEISAKTFDAAGRPVALTYDEYSGKRITPFQSINMIGSLDLRRSFVDFAMQHDIDIKGSI